MPKNIDKIPENGLGIQVMLQLVNELSYTRSSVEQNCLFLVKRYKHQNHHRLQDITKESRLKWVLDFLKPLNLLNYKRHQQPICDTPIKKIHLQVNTDIKAIVEVLRWYAQLEHLLPKEAWWQGHLALAEGFTNAVRHAHKGMPLSTPIELEVTVFNDRLEIRIWDYGQPFDLDAKVREILTLRSRCSIKMTPHGYQYQFIPS